MNRSRRTTDGRLRGRPRPDHSSGFTLVELAITMVVIVILAGAAVPTLSHLTESQQNVAATRIRTALVYAQEWAMGSNSRTWVVFDTAANTLSVYVEDPANPGKANRVALADPLTRSAMVVQLGSGAVGIDSAAFGGTTELAFDPSGEPYDRNETLLAADGTVGVTGGGTVRVTKNTGLVSVD